MGMSAGGSGGGSGGRRGGRGGRRRGGAISEINVTPLVDVMLVLLIIFMVAAPMMTVGVPIDLPQTSANALNSDTQPITISVNANGQIHLQETEIQAAEVADKLQAIATTGYNERIFVRADSVAAYGVVADVMARIQAAGFKNIGLVTQQKQDN
ncbi:protein TolR [Agrobacterium sp. SOY23]|jgi:biopolymer transport protein TolR|uniref:Protein TolR n=4 Tax=Hyphomicrobiales TaxID=356 RepID=A0A1L9C849_9HYPH|nr:MULTISPECIES: protein TolR [Rhizobium/Agrobacterium group]ANV26835.1 protein TolR [Rhizobium sp. S41]AUC11918.1 protein TolR [Rhizobium sp. Y9]EKJ97511.1 biopolymer transport protein tolR [Bradyrhizobium lupini HPC(L)]KGE81756.1 biopolymer transporter ExbD [Rhizobium sp. H41]KIV66324.1 Tol biopolymer transport system, TolR protein [Rhizobium sp. UR51a]MBB2905718.1 biopolymer transport protein TolR [Rhizobium sp. RAS22]MBM7321619.1 protein TolR [Agrobacterium sp. S2]MDP9731208.1 biopolyme